MTASNVVAELNRVIKEGANYETLVEAERAVCVLATARFSDWLPSVDVSLCVCEFKYTANYELSSVIVTEHRTGAAARVAEFSSAVLELDDKRWADAVAGREEGDKKKV